MTTSKELYERSLKIIPGGVHSPVRGFKGLDQTPIFFNSAEGAHLTDVEDKKYIDFCMSFGPLILGHSDSKVVAQIKEILPRAISFGAAEPYSLKLAEFITKNIPFVEQLRFVNSGTEAVMTAIRLARGFSKKSKILKFSGCYHGHTDSLLIKAGSGLAGESETSSLGVPNSLASDTLVAELGDLEQVEKLLIQNAEQVAAVIIEPLPANNGLLIQDESFLRNLRALTKKHNVLLIFDEVISGFRVGMTGMSGKLDITPDLVTYGKIIGGGLPVGAVGGRKDIMQNLAPVGGVYQAGTLSANPLAMAAGMATLEQLNSAFYQELESQTKKFSGELQQYFNQNAEFNNYQVTSYASLFWIHPKTQNKLNTLNNIPQDLSSPFKKLFTQFIKFGIYLAPNAYEVSFLSKAHDAKVLEEFKKKLCL